MKKILLGILSFFVLITFMSCSRKPYSFNNSIDEIESIEIVSAENSLEFTVIKTLSETEKSDFIERLQTVEFQKYFGDPPKLYGDSIKITYRNGDYEMICSYTVEYVEDGVRQFLWKKCDEKVFNDLLDKFLKEDTNQ